MSDLLIFDRPNVSTNQTIDCSGCVMISGSITVNTTSNITVIFLNLALGAVIFLTFVNTSGSSVNLKVTAPYYSVKGVTGIGVPVDLAATGATVPAVNGLCAIGNTCMINGAPYLVFNS